MRIFIFKGFDKILNSPKAPGGGKCRVPTARGAASRVQTNRSQRREWTPRWLTSLSEKKPPANTPKEPPNTEAQNVQSPMSNLG